MTRDELRQKIVSICEWVENCEWSAEKAADRILALLPPKPVICIGGPTLRALQSGDTVIVTVGGIEIAMVATDDLPPAPKLEWRDDALVLGNNLVVGFADDMAGGRAAVEFAVKEALGWSD